MHKYGKRNSIIKQPPNPTLFSGPIECQIREVSKYVYTYLRRFTFSVTLSVHACTYFTLCVCMDKINSILFNTLGNC